MQPSSRGRKMRYARNNKSSKTASKKESVKKKDSKKDKKKDDKKCTLSLARAVLFVRCCTLT